MTRRPLGRTGFSVSRLSFGASSLGGVFHEVEESDAIGAVHAALDAGINYFDVAPAYGGTRAESVLGRALTGVPRDQFILSTKVGKYTDPDHYGRDTLDYSRARIHASLAESEARLGVDHLDIVYLHDIEYQNRAHTEWAFDEGVTTMEALVASGRIGAYGFGIYPMDLWHRVLTTTSAGAALVHNHYCLNDTRLLELLPEATTRGVGIVNASPFASGLLTDRGPADWHPATSSERNVFRRAADFCRAQGTSISQLAFQFSSQHPELPTTMFSSASAESVRRNVAWHGEPFDPGLVAEVQDIIAPLRNRDWFA